MNWNFFYLVYIFFLIYCLEISLIDQDQDCRVFNKMIKIGNVNIFINPSCVCNDCIQIDKNNHVNSLIITNQTGDNLFFCCVHLRTSNAIFREIRQMTTRVLHHGLKEKIAVVYIQDPVRGLHT